MKGIAVDIFADLKALFGRSLRIVVPIGCSIALVWWLFKKVDFGDMMDVLRHNVQYGWIQLMLVFNLLSYIIRGVRWGLQLDAVGISVKTKTLCVSIFGAYALNLLFTALGEAWRCIFISRIKKAQISVVIGTDIGDRSSDAIAVLLILLVTMLLAGATVKAFLSKYPIGSDFMHFISNPVVWVVLAIVIGLIWSIFHYFHNYKIIDETEGCIERMWNGYKVLFTMPNKTKYLLLTIGIWICYFMQTYVCLYAFPFTQHLTSPEFCYGLLPGLVMLTFGSISMGIPSSGGLGPWNLAIMFALSCYGVSNTEGAAFAMLIWSAQAVLQIVLGLYSVAYVSRLEKSIE